MNKHKRERGPCVIWEKGNQEMQFNGVIILRIVLIVNLFLKSYQFLVIVQKLKHAGNISFYCALPYCVSQILSCLGIEGLW